MYSDNETEVKGSFGAVSKPAESVLHHTPERQKKAERVQNHTEQQVQALEKLIEDETVDEHG